MDQAQITRLGRPELISFLRKRLTYR
jgi:hypothetical protein